MDQNCSKFLKQLASADPTPGGGSACALAAALGASLAQMVSGLSLKKATTEQQEKFELVSAEANRLQTELLALVQQDADAFTAVMTAFGLAKTTEEQKQKRKEEIQKAFKEAATTPLIVMEKCLEVMQLAEQGIKEGNPNCVTDGGVGLWLAYAGMQGAMLNIRINLGSIKDADFVMGVDKRAKDILTTAQKLKEEVLEVLETKI